MLNKFDKYLLENIQRLHDNGYLDENPRGRYESDDKPSHCISLLGGVYEVFDISKNELPITLSRPLAVKTFIGEILTIYQNQSNRIEDFEKNGCGWWKSWDIGDGTIGNRYGYTVRKYNLIDNLLKDLAENPFSKRHIMNLYQYEDLNSSNGLHPCAYETQWTVSVRNGEKYLDLTLIQRSSDYLVAGTGINQVQYVALQMMIATHCGYKVGLFEHYRKNVHVYDRHLPQLKETLIRLSGLNKSPDKFEPMLKLNVPEGTNFYDIKLSDFEMINYNPIKPQLEKFDLAI